MAKEEFYKQCVLKEEGNSSSEKTTISWIPEKGAEVGKTMKLQDPISKKWSENRWEVISVGTQRLAASVIKERVRIARRYREATDV